ncbi:MAG: GntR family transcriptional regulator [Planctomycetaceae bacterium]|nr:GntR family transcriptional regulator [Planctomycetaceae bacterium]
MAQPAPQKKPRAKVRWVCRQIEDLILGQGMQPHHRLPSEREMSALFGCNRITLHKAIVQLCSENVLYTLPTARIHVAARPIERNLWQLLSFTDAINAARGTVTNQILEFAVEPATRQFSKLFQVPLGEEVVHLRRLRCVDNRPATIDNTFVLHKRVPGILSHDMAKEKLFTLMEEVYGIDISHGDKEIEVAWPQKWESRILELEDGEPALLMRARSFSQSGETVEYNEQLARADTFALLSEISAEDG